jgi:RHS repeat-associated protein
LITDSAGVQKYAYDYYAFGKDAAFNTGDPEALHFTGHERDYNSGTAAPNTDYLDYMHARYYSSNLGRFLSVDPVIDVKVAMANPQAWNRYSYVRNNPLRFTDPTGKYLCSGTTQQCQAFEAALQNVRDAAAKLTASHKPGATALTSVANLYGKLNKDNGVNVVITNLKGKAEGTKTVGGITTIRMDAGYLNRTSTSGNNYERMKLTETVAHAGDHGVTDQRNGDVATREEEKYSELSAYRTEGYVSQAFGVDNSHGLWTVRGGWNAEAISYWAEVSTRIWAGEPPLQP